jgi:hypothetical protein
MSALEPVFGPGTHLVIQPTEAQEQTMRQAAAGFSRRCGDRRKLHLRSRAFNLMETVFVLALVLTFFVASFAAMGKNVPISKLRGKVTEVSTFLQKARLGAIKAGLDVSVEVESYSHFDTTQVMIAYRIRQDGTKDEMGRLEIGTPDRPANAHLAGVEDGSPTSIKANTFKDSKLVYRSSGMAANQGAFRFSIGKGKKQNTIEVAVPSLGGQPVVRKFIRPAERPSGGATQEFFEATHYGTDWQWTWY